MIIMFALPSRPLLQQEQATDLQPLPAKMRGGRRAQGGAEIIYAFYDT